MEKFRSPDVDTFFAYDEEVVKDEFERRRFSDHLARIIMEEKGGKPLVISIVNPWGGGKSTILQYIKDAIAATTRDECPNVKNCRITSFNLWRYAGEEQLLYRLFESLIKAINQSLPLTARQELLQVLPTWVKRFSLVCDWLVPKTGVLIDGVFATISPDQFKVRLDEVREVTCTYLAKTGMRVIMLLDDVDRLDPDEILMLFRALKLIADLPNTTFIIAMDEEHVSQVIGGRIGGGIESGRRYIEKIVTVRLAVPKIPSHIFEDYVFGHFVTIWRRELSKRAKEQPINASAAEAIRTEPDPAEVEDMISIFRRLHLPYVQTPRTVKTIGNAFAFALGLLPNEVDVRDVLLLEATRLLHPKLYRALPDLLPILSRLSSLEYTRLIGVIESVLDDGDEPRKDAAAIVDRLAACVDESEDRRIKQIKSSLNFWFCLEETNTGKRPGKRISSPSYFWRYFSGALHKGDVQDQEVSEWLRLALNASRKDEAVSRLKAHLNKPYCQAFLSKLEELMSALSDNQSPLLIIAEVVATFPETAELTSRRSLWHHAASVIANTITENSDQTTQLEIAASVIKASKNLRWNFMFCDHVATNAFLTFPAKKGETRVPSPFDVELANQSLDAYESGDTPTSNALICGMVWSIYRNRYIEGLVPRVQKLVINNPQLGMHFLAAGCAFGESEKHTEFCWKWNGEKGLRSVEELIPIPSLERSLDMLPPKGLVNRRSGRISDYLTLTEVGWECLASIEERKRGGVTTKQESISA